MRAFLVLDFWVNGKLIFRMKLDGTSWPWPCAHKSSFGFGLEKVVETWNEELRIRIT